MKIKIIIFLGAVLFLIGCAPSRSTLSNKQHMPPASPVDFVLIYIIHGDADYIYHDSTGHYHVADMEAVHQATTVGLESQQGEVFIFHLKPGSTFFSHSPRGVFYHYKNGIKISQENYTRSDIDLGFEVESKLFQSTTSVSSHYYLVYFGHRIQEVNGQGYSSSFPKIPFSLTEFSQGVKNLIPKNLERNKPFNLIVLSTCQGGSDPTLKALAPLTDYLVASPENLHLSYFNTLAFKDTIPERHPQDGNRKVFNLAEAITNQSFNQLQKMTQTEITVSLYDFSTHKDSIQVIEQLTQAARFGSSK